MIIMACDKAGVEYVQKCAAYFEQHGMEYTISLPEDKNAYWYDYPDAAESVARAVADGKAQFGVLICGTGIGMSIAANKVKGIRAAVCGDTFSAEMTRRHNDANVICLGARVLGEELMLRIVDAFFTAPFEGTTEAGKRHLDRVKKISRMEEKF